MTIDIQIELYSIDSQTLTISDIHEEIAKAIKPFLDKYHTNAVCNVVGGTLTKTVQGAWNG